MTRLLAAVALAAVACYCACAPALAATGSLSFTYLTNATALNPFRGFAAYLDNIGPKPYFPTSLEYSYVALSDVLVAENTCDWTIVDAMVARATARGHHTILRLYVDYPACCGTPDGTYVSGVPSFLNTGANPVTYQNYLSYGGGMSPNYTNTRLIDAMVYTIGQFGARYDSDSRIAFIQCGLLGFWGEFHTYTDSTTSTPTEVVTFATRTVQLRILNAYDAAFNTIKVLVSQDEFQYWTKKDAAALRTSNLDIGWHDDAFCDSTYDVNDSEDYFLYDRMVSHQVLSKPINVTHPIAIGGELYPDLQSSIFGTGKYSGQAFAPAVTVTHATWLLNNYPFNKDTNLVRRANTEAAALLLGYQFFLSGLSFAPATTCACAVPPCYCSVATATVINKGSAPFLYDLAFALTDQTGGVAYAAPSVNSAGNGTSVSVSVAIMWRGVTGVSTVGNFSAALTCSRTLPLGSGVKFANAGITTAGAVPFLVQPEWALLVSDAGVSSSSTGASSSVSSSFSTGATKSSSSSSTPAVPSSTGASSSSTGATAKSSSSSTGSSSSTARSSTAASSSSSTVHSSTAASSTGHSSSSSSSSSTARSSTAASSTAHSSSSSTASSSSSGPSSAATSSTASNAPSSSSAAQSSTASSGSSSTAAASSSTADAVPSSSDVSSTGGDGSSALDSSTVESSSAIVADSTADSMGSSAASSSTGTSTPLASVTVTFKMNYAIDSLPGSTVSSFSLSLKSDIATALNVATTRISITRVVAGSVVVDVEFLADDSDSTAKTPTVLAQEFIAQVNDASSALFAQSTTSATIQGSAAVSTDGDSNDSSDSNVLTKKYGGLPGYGILVLAAVGLILFISLGVWCSYKRKKLTIAQRMLGRSTDSAQNDIETEFGHMGLRANPARVTHKEFGELTRV